jgi:hypothetical protein
MTARPPDVQRQRHTGAEYEAGRVLHRHRMNEEHCSQLEA